MRRTCERQQSTYALARCRSAGRQLRCVCGCRPSCRWFVVGFSYLTVEGRCCRNLQLTLLCSFVAGETIAKIIPHRPRLITLEDSKTRHHTPLFRMMFVYHITLLGVSRSKEIWLEICRSLHIYSRICFELSTFFGQPEDV